MPVSPSEFMIRMLIAILGGMLIGLERERAQISGKSKQAGSIPGMRSFGLLSLYGALSSYTASLAVGSSNSWPVILSVAFASTILLVLMYSYTRMVALRVPGITTYIVLYVTFLIGVLAGAGLTLESAGVSVLVTLVLSLKQPAERAAAAISYSELLAIIEVSALALILGPIIKAASLSFGLDLIYKTYVFFVIILFVSLISYMAARIWGAKGVLYASILGALVNSEAAITSLAERLSKLSSERQGEELGHSLTPLVILIAQIKLVALALIAVPIFAGALEPTLIYHLLAASLYLAVLIYFVKLEVSRVQITSSWRLEGIEIQSPLSWGSAIKSAVAYAIMTGLFIIANKYNLPLSTYTPILLSFLGGLVSATAVILSLGTTILTFPACAISSSVMAVLAAVSLNKILYARASKASKGLLRIVYRWSLILAVPPLVLTVAILYGC